MDKQALLHGDSAVSVLPLAWRAFGGASQLWDKGPRYNTKSQSPLCSLLCVPLPWSGSAWATHLWRVGYWTYLPLSWALTPLQPVRWEWSGFYNEDLPSGWFRKHCIRNLVKKPHMDTLFLPRFSKIRSTIKTQPSSSIKRSDVFGKVRILPQLPVLPFLAAKIRIRNNQKSLIQTFCILGKSFRLSLVCPSRLITLVFLALQLPHLKWLIISTAHIADGSEPFGAFWKLFLCPRNTMSPQSQCFLY